MKYKMKVRIVDPVRPKGIFSEVVYVLFCEFAYDDAQYGNGCSVKISGPEFGERIYDLRYNSSFSKDKEPEWLENWATGFWTGKNGSWKLEEMIIERMAGNENS